MFDPDNGLINALLQQVGLPTVGWLTDPTWSKPALILLSLWGLGASALIFLAGLQEIPPALLDAAAIDGAGPWRFRHVTLPLLTPVILFNLVMGVISSFHIFTQALVVGGHRQTAGVDAHVHGPYLPHGFPVLRHGAGCSPRGRALPGRARRDTGDLPIRPCLGILGQQGQ